MAMIKCPQCKSDISENAVACQFCAYPSNKFLSIYTAVFEFLIYDREGIEKECIIYDENYKKLALCKIGSKASII